MIVEHILIELAHIYVASQNLHAFKFFASFLIMDVKSWILIGVHVGLNSKVQVVFNSVCIIYNKCFTVGARFCVFFKCIVEFHNIILYNLQFEDVFVLFHFNVKFVIYLHYLHLSSSFSLSVIWSLVPPCRLQYLPIKLPKKVSPPIKTFLRKKSSIL